MSAEALRLLRDWLAPRLDAAQSRWLAEAGAALAAGAAPAEFCALFSAASRHLPRGPLAPSAQERARAGALLAGWDPELWTLLETGRVALLLAHPGVGDARIERALEEAFRYPEVGEQCALYRALALLPEPQRFAWRAGEGARSNMRPVFQAACCDTPYPVRWFDDVAWRSAVIKCLFVEAPLWRVYGLDGRLDAELARMALDLADERTSAGRAVNPELWMCLGAHAGPRGLAALERELERGDARGRAGAVLGLARAGERRRLTEHRARERDALVQATLARALAGDFGQRAWRALDPGAGAD
jgi:hypothetical protein